MNVRWFVSVHALKRMKQMKVDRVELVTCLNSPEYDYPGHPVPRRVAVRGRLAVVYEPPDKVVTVLWAGRETRTTA